MNTCIRNTEEAERNSKGTGSAPSSAISETSAGAGRTESQIVSGKGQKKGVWGLIEESELARSIRKDEEKKVRFFIFSFRYGFAHEGVAIDRE